MSYFSRLTDIVTCNLSDILSREADPRTAIERIISEMQEGLAGANRSVKAATASQETLEREIAEQSTQIEYWRTKAREELVGDREDQARLALVRKREAEDVLAGLQQQHRAAIATREHLTTTLRALEGRLAEARRKMSQIESRDSGDRPEAGKVAVGERTAEQLRAPQIDAELEALKRELER